MKPLEYTLFRTIYKNTYKIVATANLSQFRPAEMAYIITVFRQCSDKKSWENVIGPDDIDKSLSILERLEQRRDIQLYYVNENDLYDAKVGLWQQFAPKRYGLF